MSRVRALAGGALTGLVVVASTFLLIIRSWLGRGWHR